MSCYNPVSKVASNSCENRASFHVLQCAAPRAVLAPGATPAWTGTPQQAACAARSLAQLGERGSIRPAWHSGRLRFPLLTGETDWKLGWGARPGHHPQAFRLSLRGWESGAEPVELADLPATRPGCERRPPAHAWDLHGFPLKGCSDYLLPRLRGFPFH